MQRPEYQPAYHDAFPSLLPKDGWRRQEIHDRDELFELAEQLEADMRALGYPRRDTNAWAITRPPGYIAAMAARTAA
jgi:hypothetical protein